MPTTWSASNIKDKRTEAMQQEINKLCLEELSASHKPGPFATLLTFAQIQALAKKYQPKTPGEPVISTTGEIAKKSR